MAKVQNYVRKHWRRMSKLQYNVEKIPGTNVENTKL